MLPRADPTTVRCRREPPAWETGRMGRAGDGNTDRRRRARRSAGEADVAERSWLETAQSWPDGDFAVRQVSGSSDGRVFRCPGCDQELPSSLPHTVAWPEGRLD